MICQLSKGGPTASADFPIIGRSPTIFEILTHFVGLGKEFPYISKGPWGADSPLFSGEATTIFENQSYPLNPLRM
jgi:hypothetical protein